MADKTTKYVLALLLIGVVLSMLPSGPSGGSIFKTFFGNMPFLTGSNGATTTLPDGTTTQVALIPANQVSFKLMLIASYEDGTNATVFEQSSLPGLAVISIGNKPVRDIRAVGLVAVALTRPLPSDAKAMFTINFTYYISQVNMAKWIVKTVQTPLVGNNTLALAMLPESKVLGGEVFPTASTTKESRRVDWRANVQVTITASGYAPLSLIGGTDAFAIFNYDGSLTGGGTDTGTGGSTIAGATVGFGPLGSFAKFDFDPCVTNPASCNPTVTEGVTRVTLVGVQTVGGITKQVTEVQTKAANTGRLATIGAIVVSLPITVTVYTSTIVADPISTVRGEIKDVNFNPDRKILEQLTSINAGRLETYGTPASTTREIAISLLPLGELVPISYVRFDFAGTAYLVHPLIILILIGAALYLVFLYGKQRK